MHCEKKGNDLKAFVEFYFKGKSFQILLEFFEKFYLMQKRMKYQTLYLIDQIHLQKIFKYGLNYLTKNQSWC